MIKIQVLAISNIHTVRSYERNKTFAEWSSKERRSENMKYKTIVFLVTRPVLKHLPALEILWVPQSLVEWSIKLLNTCWARHWCKLPSKRLVSFKSDQWLFSCFLFLFTFSLFWTVLWDQENRHLIERGQGQKKGALGLKNVLHLVFTKH